MKNEQRPKQKEATSATENPVRRRTASLGGGGGYGRSLRTGSDGGGGGGVLQAAVEEIRSIGSTLLEELSRLGGIQPGIVQGSSTEPVRFRCVACGKIEGKDIKKLTPFCIQRVMPPSEDGMPPVILAQTELCCLECIEKLTALNYLVKQLIEKNEAIN